MTNALRLLNNLDAGAALEYLQHCCNSIIWTHQMVSARPYDSEDALAQSSDAIWEAVPFEDRLEAFDGHPRFGNQFIGSRSLHEQWAQQEHQVTANLSESILSDLKARNLDYENNFGFTFIAHTGNRSLDDLFLLIDQRMNNDPETEVAVASEEQRRILRSRLKKLLRIIETDVLKETHRAR